MNFNHLIQICGLPLVAALIGLSGLLTVASCLLIFKARRELLLSAFFPLCFLPLLLSIVAALFGLMGSIDAQLVDEDGLLRDSGFLLSTNLVVLLFGASVSAMPAAVTMLGRWTLAWQASGLRLLPERSERDDAEGGFDPEAWANQEAENYLEELVRPR